MKRSLNNSTTAKPLLTILAPPSTRPWPRSGYTAAGGIEISERPCRPLYAAVFPSRRAAAMSLCVMITAALPGCVFPQDDSNEEYEEYDAWESDDDANGTINDPGPWSPDNHYSSKPAIDSCKAGAVSDFARNAALDAVNEVRSLSGLPPVQYIRAGDSETQAAALVMAANGALDHFPPESWDCWSQAALDGASTSNLHMGWSTAESDISHPAQAVVAFLIDSGVETLGHRRWILDPFLPGISFGSVNGKTSNDPTFPYVEAAALQVIHDQSADISNTDISYVAYPHNDYPTEYFDKNWYLSFSALPDRTSAWANNNVDFNSASIKVTGPSGQLGVTSVSHSNEGFGVPNHLQWKVTGLQNGAKYTVEISNVKVGGTSNNYSYWFRIN